MKAFISAFGAPEQMTRWTLGAMVDLRDSICDLAEQKVFAWFTRLRQPEELYIRTLYNLFVANEKQLHHTLSGQMPNSFASLYDDVNKVVSEGRGLLLTAQPGLDPPLRLHRKTCSTMVRTCPMLHS